MPFSRASKILISPLSLTCSVGLGIGESRIKFNNGVIVF